MREILFRGKRVDNGEWVYGFYNRCEARLTYTEKYYKNNPRSWIQTLENEGFAGQLVHVDTDTVGQYTGLIDKNGTRIFEGDVVEWDSKEWGCEQRELVEWNYELLDMRKNDWKEWCEVIGNIHDNPDMITDKGEG